MKKLMNRALAMGLMMLVIAGPVLAAAGPKPPAPPALRNAPPVWLGLLIMALLLAIVMAVSLMPSKRSHLD